MTRQEFYQTKAWKTIRKNIWLRQSCLCNRCHRPVYVNGISEWIPKNKRLKGIVHHTEYLNDNNYNDDNIALNEDKLEGVCIDCHNSEHFSTQAIRQDLTFDSEGNIINKSPLLRS